VTTNFTTFDRVRAAELCDEWPRLSAYLNIPASVRELALLARAFCAGRAVRCFTKHPSCAHEGPAECAAARDRAAASLLRTGWTPS